MMFKHLFNFFVVSDLRIAINNFQRTGRIRENAPSRSSLKETMYNQSHRRTQHTNTHLDALPCNVVVQTIMDVILQTHSQIGHELCTRSDAVAVKV